AGICRGLEQAEGALIVGLDTVALEIYVAEMVEGEGVAAASRLHQPRDCLGGILRNALAVAVEHAQAGRRIEIVVGGGLVEELNGFVEIFPHARASLIERTELI